MTEATRERARQRARAWYAKNRERALERQRQQHAANPHLRRERARKWQAANPERAKAKHRRWYEANREAVLARNRKWREDNPEAWRAINARCQAKRRAVKSGVSVEEVDPLTVFERDGWCCQICGRLTSGAHPDPASPSLDHIVPLSKGGAHSYENTQCACLGCNIRKGASLEVAA